jgi:hypothetical protein
LVGGLFRSGDAGEGVGSRRGGGIRGWELMRVHTRIKRSTREGENELRELEIGPMSVGRREIGIFLSSVTRISGVRELRGLWAALSKPLQPSGMEGN